MALNKRKLAQKGKDSWIIYKGDSDNDITTLIATLKEHHVKSVMIHKWGNITEKDLTEIDSWCDDYAYHQLDLKINDPFIVTKELTALKMDEEKKIGKLRKQPERKPKQKLRKILDSSFIWSDEHIEELWKGPKEIVATIVGKTVQAVERKRREYVMEHPKFEYPEACKTPRKNAAKPKELPFYGEWSTDELSILWEKTGKEISELTNRTTVNVQEKRILYCKENPNFEIPLKAKFKKGDLPNTVESLRKKKAQTPEIQNEKLQTPEIQNKKMTTLPIEDNIVSPASQIGATASTSLFSVASNIRKMEGKRPFTTWTNEEKGLLWSASASTIISKFSNRTRQQIYLARRYFLEKNPKFVIPLIAEFKLPKGLPNPVETVHNIGHVLTSGELLREPVLINNPVIKHDLALKSEITPSFDLAELINKLTVKPKSIRIVNGEPIIDF